MDQPTPESSAQEPTLAPQHAARNYRDPLLAILALVIVLAVGAYLRFTGLMWGDYQYPHPDERFLVWVVADIQPVPNIGAYFDTATSSLNPANRGHAFYVYGDFPVILARYAANWFFAEAGWAEILKTGRALSAIGDLLTVLLVFLTAERLLGWRAAFLSGLFAAGAVLMIQQAHFFTTDAISTTFTMLAVYLAVLIATARRVTLLSLAFGAAVGLAMACKINTFPVAVLIALALAVNALRRWRLEGESWRAWLWPFALAAVLSGVVAFAVFRVAQPYAFSGPKITNIIPDPGWMKSMQDQRAQASGDVDFPPALQWARRSHLFSFDNMVLWGLGIPLGVLAWVMFAIFVVEAGWRVVKRGPNPAVGKANRDPFPKREGGVDGDGEGVKIYDASGSPSPSSVGLADDGEGSLLRNVGGVRWYDPFLQSPWPGLLLVLFWTGAYFLWQSTAWNPTMRYQLPVYPTLCVIAGVGVVYWLRRSLPGIRSAGLWRAGIGTVGALVAVLTLAWALAFVQIYHRTETRAAASRWIFANVPGPVTLHSADGSTQPVPISGQAVARGGRPYLVAFDNVQAGALTGLHLTNVRATGAGAIALQAQIIDPAKPGQVVAQASQVMAGTGSFDALDVTFSGMQRLEGAGADGKGHRYTLALGVVNADGSPANSNSVAAVLGTMQLNLYGQAQSVAFPMGQVGLALTPLTLQQGGMLRQIRVPAGAVIPAATVVVHDPITNQEQDSTAQLANALGGQAGAPQPGGDAGGGADSGIVMTLSQPIEMKAGVNYQVAVVSAGGVVDTGQQIQLDFLDSPAVQYLPEPALEARSDDSVYTVFAPQEAMRLQQVTLAHAVQEDPTVGAGGLTLTLTRSDATGTPLAQARADLPASAAGNDPRGGALTFTFGQPVVLDKGINYTITLAPDAGVAAMRGSSVANESDWDMGLPFRMDNYDPFGGIYRGDLNFQAYWDDNPDKYQRFINAIDQTDYIFISSNRQWGTTTRVPERYPLTTEYYRDLIGCPADRSILWCYDHAAPGTFQGKLGFDLVQVFTSYPTLGPVVINDQSAEEAFTVYDHPKVFVFKKRADFNVTQVESLLGAVDLTNVVHLTPRKASGFKDGLLPANLLAIQQAGGTWAKLFPPEGLQNRYPWLGLVLWYLTIFVLGLFAYPLVRLALPGLPDRGYPLARMVGMVILAYFAWLAGSLLIPVTRATVAVVFALLGAAGIVLAFLQRDGLRAEWREHKGYFLRVEMVMLALFAIDLGIRLGNPDLWHPIFGGEKPMDFSYFNAVLKSTIFPPYDPWFAGGSMNYYYYGYVIVGMPLKLVGITPSVAYNLILPTLFGTVGLAAFSIGWNLYVAGRMFFGNAGLGNSVMREEAVADNLPAAEENLTPPAPSPLRREGEPAEEPGPTVPRTGLPHNALPNNGLPDNALPIDALPSNPLPGRQVLPFLPALVATIFLLLLGNLGTVRMYWQGFQKMVVDDQTMQKGTLAQHWGWAIQGAGKWISDPTMNWPYYPGDWYWKPSRAIQPETGGEITEFPFFTFLYADLHAHMMALPVTLLAIAWALGLVLGRGRWGEEDLTPRPPSRSGKGEGEGEKRRWGWLSWGLALGIGALVTGALRPANTWDQYTYLTFAAAAVLYSQWRGRYGWLRALGMAAALMVLAVLLYRPFDQWFAQGYNALEPWTQDHTDLNSYLVHWGLFLFVIVSWLFGETVAWMASTRLSAVNRYQHGRAVLTAALILFVLALLILVVKGVEIAVIVVPLGVWATILLFRPGMPDAKRFVLFMTGTALLLTLAVELVAVKGDIGRMNTVFKFYFQAWSLFALSAAAGLGWLWERVRGWNTGWRDAWVGALALLVFSCALYPIVATRAKIEDRMVADAPHVLDGMAYMNYAKYTDGPDNGPSAEMDLSQDYQAIHWVQQNVTGSPVIVEANTPEYRHWGTRFTIYTGLPGVVGWNWHERQQRALTPDTWVFDRIDAIGAFYKTTSRADAEAFLKQYGVKYIIVGQLERIYYQGPGLDKFTQLNGTLWDQVYQEGQTVIYRVR